MTNDISPATIERDRGIDRAARHADAVDPSWTARALEAFALYARHNRQFLTEEVRAAAEASGLPPPPDERAWGAVAVAAGRRFLVVHAGYVSSRQAQGHRGPRSLWESRCYRDA